MRLSLALTLAALTFTAGLQADEPKAACSMRVVVLDPQGQPLKDANIHIGIWTEEKGFKGKRDYTTDAAGTAALELPKTITTLRVWAGKKPFVTMVSCWEQDDLASGGKLPAEYTFRLETAATASGRIVNEQGKPVAGAKVEVMAENASKPTNSDGRVSYDTWLANGADVAVSDADGRWRIDNMPDTAKVELALKVSHPDFVSDEFWRQTQKASGVTTALLRHGTATMTLKPGVIVRGQVTDADGKPVKDAIVVFGDDPYFAGRPTEFPTDADGQYRLPALAPRETTLTVVAPGWAPQLRRVQLQAGLPPQNFRLEPGQPIRLRIIDAVGLPVPQAYVSLDSWKGKKSLHNQQHPNVRDTKIPRRATADGIWEWTWAPADPVKLRVGLKGFADSEVEIAGGGSEHTVVLKAEHRITGNVIDETTGKPIPAFTIVPLDVFRKDWLHAERGNAEAGRDGALNYLASRTDIPLRLRVEASGYRTQDGPEFRVGDDTSRTQNFRLRPSRPITGVILDTGGRPLANAEVLLATPTGPANLEDGHGNHKATTDAQGRFAFPDTGEQFAVLARADSGFAHAEFPSDRSDVGELRLKPWASVHGQLRDGGRPVVGATMILQPIRVNNFDAPRIDAIAQVVTGPDGHFAFPRVGLGPVSVRAFLGPWKDEVFRSGPSVPLDIQPGQRVELDLGRAGATVSGRVKLTGKVPADLDCNYSLNFLVRREPGIVPPLAVANFGFDVRSGWRDTWHNSVEGQAYFNTLQYWFVKLAPDGGFRISPPCALPA